MTDHNDYCEDRTDLERPGSFYLSTRFGLAIIAFFGFVSLYAMRINMSVALVAMLNHTATQQPLMNYSTNETLLAHECGIELEHNTNQSTDQLDGEFLWTKKQQGIILGAFFWGYMVTQVPGGLLSERFGGKMIFGVTMIVAAVATLLCPVASRLSYFALVFLRILIGLCNGVVFPAMHMVWSNWAPPMERSKLVGFSYAGNQIGNVVTLPLAAFLCLSVGWEYVFYLIGIASIVWAILFLLLTTNTPGEHKRISIAEKNYIEKALAGEIEHDKKLRKKSNTPWKQILLSKPVWAITVSHTCANFGTYLMLTSLPLFMKEVLNFDMKKNGLLSAIPYVTYFVAANVAGILADYLRKNGYLSTTAVRKLAMTTALCGQATFFMAAAYCGCGQENLAVFFIALAQGVSGFQYAGWVVNHVDIAPRFAGTLFGFGNTFATMSGILAPAVVAAMTPHKSRTEWQAVYWVASAILVFGAAFYMAFGSGVMQSWAIPESVSKAKLQALYELQAANVKEQTAEPLPEGKQETVFLL